MARLAVDAAAEHGGRPRAEALARVAPLFAPFGLISWAQRRLLGYPAPMRMTPVPHAEVVRLVAANDGEIIDSRPDLPYTEDWRCSRYALRRR